MTKISKRLKAVADLSERRIIDTLVLPPVDIIKSNTQMMPNLNKIIVHNQTKELEKMAFFMCSGKEIILGKGIKVIGMQAFAYSKFETITILSDDYTLCEEALIKTKILKTIKGLDGARLIEENALGVGLYKMELRDCGLERQSLTNTRHLYIKEYVDIFKELTVNNCTIHISKEDYNRLKHKITGTYTVTFE